MLGSLGKNRQTNLGPFGKESRIKLNQDLRSLRWRRQVRPNRETVGLVPRALGIIGIVTWQTSQNYGNCIVVAGYRCFC